MELMSLGTMTGLPTTSELLDMCGGSEGLCDSVMSDYVPSYETRYMMTLRNDIVGLPGVDTANSFVSSIAKHSGRSYEAVLMDSLALPSVK